MSSTSGLCGGAIRYIFTLVFAHARTHILAVFVITLLLDGMHGCEYCRLVNAAFRTSVHRKINKTQRASVHMFWHATLSLPLS